MAAYNYNSQPTPQAIGAAMMPVAVQDAAQMPMTSGNSMMGLDPKTMQALMQQSQGGLTPGGTGGLSTMSMFGGGGNPLGLSSGTSFSPDDLTKLAQAFQNG